ncbi:hypothetical protein [Streptomyces sp. MNP-20]|uniref:hypothetical protein n=1 Tax=Streptomyces sp. MNP-20 TaxID=2721165 RepID=UPI001551B5C2|nr:hypothetical protein [Streptomyces sp. MNP-20]
MTENSHTPLSDSVPPLGGGDHHARPPFYITSVEEKELRVKAELLVPSPTVEQPSSFDEYVRQLLVPPVVMDLVRKAAHVRLATWEVQAIRALLAPPARPPGKPGKEPAPGGAGLLREILIKKAAIDPTHPPYIRVACTGRGTYDDLAVDRGDAPAGARSADFGSPAVLEIWPAQHYSPIHSHGDTTGIILCLTGRLDVMSYDRLAWEADKRGLGTLTPGMCAWLSRKHYAVHKVHCPLDGGPRPAALLNDTGDFAASFHVYLNEDETSVQEHVPAVLSRDVFRYIDEHDHTEKSFTTYSDLSWSVLRHTMARIATRQ